MQRLKKKLNLLQRLAFEHSSNPRPLENFKYLPLSELEVKVFEKRNKITLPEDYRDFLIHIANGGIGPANGILPLDSQRTYPLVHLPWIDPILFNELFQFDESKENAEQFENRIKGLLEQEGTEIISIRQNAENGIMAIGDAGCGLYHCLVVNGKNKGQIWTNATLNDDGFYLVADNFFEWFEKWLDEEIKKQQVKNIAIEELYIDNTSAQFLPKDVIELKSFIEQFKDLKDKKPVKSLLNELVREECNLELIDQCLHYLLDDLDYIDFNLALKFLNKFPKNLDETNLKKKLCHKGKTMIGLNNYNNASIYFEKAIEVGVDKFNHGHLNQQAILELCYCYLKLEETQMALCIIAPNNKINVGQMVSSLKNIYHRHKDYKTAIKYGESILRWEVFKQDEINKNVVLEIYLILVQSYAHLKNEQQVKSFVEKIKTLKESLEKISFEHIALELFNAKCYKLTVEYLEIYSGFKRAKDNLQWLLNLKGCCFKAIGYHEKAKYHFEKSYQIFHWVVPYSNLIRYYLHSENLEKAEQIFNEIKAFNPQYNWSYYQFAPYFLKTENKEKALESLQRAIELGFDKNIILDDPELECLASMIL